MLKIFLSLCFFLLTLSHASAKTPCAQMAKKICNSLGLDAFFCRTYNRVARHPSADHKRCKLLMKSQWQKRLGALKRQENILQQMQLLSQGNPNQTQQYKAYRSSLAQKTLRGMLKAGARKAPTLPANSCRMLAAQACKDLGHKSFYCGIFVAASRSKASKPSKCFVILKNWNTSQLASYSKRERYLAIMGGKARTKKQKLQLLQIRRNQRLKILRFLRQ